MAVPYPTLLGSERRPPSDVSYVHVLRGAGREWWRPVIGVLLALSLYALLTSFVGGLVLRVGYATAGA
ncbi:hypothetical protein, partial [Klebsiella pneumoniae]|uniref:hypothetical protein n=1 Tax=Klebsiella pneumoniae TaxID=573 RepID=UPI001D0EB730